MTLKEQIQTAVDSGNPVVVDFWRDGCAPCKALVPQLDRMQNIHPNLTVIKVKQGESDEATELFQTLNIRSAPTLYFYNEGKEVAVHAGGLPAAKMLGILGLSKE